VLYAAPIGGARLVLPGPRLDGASLYELMETEKVTVSAGVPTIWLALMQHVEQNGLRFSSMRRTAVGGSAMPASLIAKFADDYGVEVRHGWGMTETTAVVTMSCLAPQHLDLPAAEQHAVIARQGKSVFGIETSPLVDGWFPTGDIATIDAQGVMQIRDRAKDVIKTGGEWISSIDLENAAVGHPAVTMAAVIGVKHPKWDERPLLFIVRKSGQSVEREDILAFLTERVVKFGGCRTTSFFWTPCRWVEPARCKRAICASNTAACSADACYCCSGGERFIY